MSDIIRFEIAKINRGKKKICQCENPHYELDTVNRIVMCEDCGAVLDAFDVLVHFTEDMERIEKREERMLQKAKEYGKMADRELTRMLKNKVFREMNNQYRHGMFPVCPQCGELFDPINISRWSNKTYLGDNDGM